MATGERDARVKEVWIVYVVAIHNISDPQKFWAAVQATAIPEAITLHNVLPDTSGSKAVCLWEADTQDTVSTFVNGVVGHYSNNGFFEVGAANAVGLPS